MTSPQPRLEDGRAVDLDGPDDGFPLVLHHGTTGSRLLDARLAR